MIFCENMQNQFILEGVNISDIVIRGYFADVANISEMSINNTNCSIVNKTTLFGNLFFDNIGGFCKSKNILFRNFENLSLKSLRF